MKKIIASIFIFCFSYSYACDKCIEEMFEYVRVMKFHVDQSDNECSKSYIDGTVNGLNISLKMFKENHETNYFPD